MASSFLVLGPAAEGSSPVDEGRKGGPATQGSFPAAVAKGSSVLRPATQGSFPATVKKLVPRFSVQQLKVPFQLQWPKFPLSVQQHKVQWCWVQQQQEQMRVGTIILEAQQQQEQRRASALLEALQVVALKETHVYVSSDQLSVSHP